jgi:REP element-mobilizing transposase RayT
MPSPNPIYTPENCHAAYQLDWSLTVFWCQPLSAGDWLGALQQATEPDDVRVLQHRFLRPDISQFLVSTKPHVAPYALVRSVKGRLQYIVRSELAKPFRNKYGLRSIGSSKREQVERYVESQAQHHPMADPRAQAIFERYQICNAAVDLSKARQAGTGIFWYNLHVAFVHRDRFREIDERQVRATRDTIQRASDKHGYLLSRAGIVSDHCHLTLGCSPERSPAEVALSYMSNLAFVRGMKAVFEHGFYVGTVGEYDLNVIPRP